MAVCAIKNINGLLQVTSEAVCSEFVLVSQSDFDNFQSVSLIQLRELLSTLFIFDPTIFAIVEGGLITAFLTSHFAGRMVRYLGKA